MRSSVLLILTLALAFETGAPAAPQADDANRAGEEMVNAYFSAETAGLAGACLQDVNSLADWMAKRTEYRGQLFEMLGLWPLPEKNDLQPVISGRIEQDEFAVEKLAFQSLPGLYVTANLYLPKNLTNPAPAVLYLCGHSKVVTNGVSYGNKTAYQHHGAWFARNGYVCLILDTIQLGELQGVHHGTFREKMWWWNSRGYTPAGVEVWNAIRALDYLQSRPEVDGQRLGVTGRSGGGAYSWYVTALDDRIKVAAPIAGITDLQNHIVDGAIEGHCDCMYMVNTYRWDFPLVAALAAPRPLLLGNSDKDPLFPLDGIIRLHAKVKRVYDLYGASIHLGLLITEGPHQDTQDLQLPVFRWFNRFLKGQESVIDMAATHFFKAEDLKVFAAAPTNECTTHIHKTFVPAAPSPRVPANKAEWAEARSAWKNNLAQKVFAAWPLDSGPAQVQSIASSEKPRIFFQQYQFISQDKVVLPLYVLRSSHLRPKELVVRVLDESDWQQWGAILTALREQRPLSAAYSQAVQSELAKGAVAFLLPRGIGPTAWGGDENKQTHIRRRFMLLGTTLDAMRVWDICRGLEALNLIADFNRLPVELQAHGQMGVNALYAALFVPPLKQLQLAGLPDSHETGPDYLNVLKFLDIPQAVAMASERSPVQLTQCNASKFRFASDTARVLGWHTLQIEP